MDWPDYMDNVFGDAFGLFYDAERNLFIDEDGFIIYSIFEIITPNDLFLFKRNKEYMCIPHRSMKHVLVELYYPDQDDYYNT